jgi:hypothetical protein
MDMERFMILAGSDSSYLFGGIGFSVIANMTWFFSSHKMFFIKCFVPWGPLRVKAYADLPEEPLFKKTLRGFTIAEFLIALIFILLWFFID